MKPPQFECILSKNDLPSNSDSGRCAACGCNQKYTALFYLFSFLHFTLKDSSHVMFEGKKHGLAEDQRAAVAKKGLGAERTLINSFDAVCAR